MTSADDLLRKADARGIQIDHDLFHLAYDFAKDAHGEQKRLSGEPYFSHPVATVAKLIDLGLDQSTILAGLLHDVPEDTKVSLKEIEKNFGGDVARLVDGVTKLSAVKYRGVERYQENLRRMFLAMAKDIRVIFIKFADRLHNLQTLGALPPEKRKRIAVETLEIYAPIANRLGMGQIKGELEDAAFQFALPKSFEELTRRIQEPLSQRRDYLERVTKMVTDELTRDGIPFRMIDGRAKHLYSLHLKLIAHENDLSKIYDLIAMRIVVNTIPECYAALGTVHRLWTPLKGRIKDYIAQPKPNGYQSIHTTVFCEEGKIVEMQIRTQEMHDAAEFGIAAHWNYDEQRKESMSVRREVAWVNDVLQRQKEIGDHTQYVESLKFDVFRTQIFVFTPDGDVIELPEDATPVDFAYAIHTDIGDHCSASRVNDKLVSLDTPLKSGDVCEIIIEKNRKGASTDWLDFVKTSQAREKIKHSARRAESGTGGSVAE